MRRLFLTVVIFSVFCAPAQAKLSAADHQTLSALYHLQSGFIGKAKQPDTSTQIKHSKGIFVAKLRQNNNHCWNLFVSYFPEDYTNDMDIYAEAKWLATQKPLVGLFSSHAKAIHRLAAAPGISANLRSKLKALDAYWASSLVLDQEQQAKLKTEDLCSAMAEWHYSNWLLSAKPQFLVSLSRQLAQREEWKYAAAKTEPRYWLGKQLFAIADPRRGTQRYEVQAFTEDYHRFGIDYLYRSDPLYAWFLKQIDNAY